MDTMTTKDEGALVLLSGGQDSATCLAWALKQFPLVETVGFDYGQRHQVELDCRFEFRDVVERGLRGPHGFLGDDHLLPLPALNMIADTALTRGGEIVVPENGLPNTFVPGRNLLMLTYAAALAWRRGLRHIVTGVCETDFSGYPDCRDDTIKALQVAINLGMERRFVLHTPLMWRTKAQTWALAHELGGDTLVRDVVEHTHTCYKGDHTTHHEWGFGCGECPACLIRRRGWEEWRAGADAAAGSPVPA